MGLTNSGRSLTALGVGSGSMDAFNGQDLAPSSLDQSKSDFTMFPRVSSSVAKRGVGYLWKSSIFPLILFSSAPFSNAENIFDIVPRAIANDLPGTWVYEGCYTDSVASRTLQGINYANGTDMTQESCIAFCDVNGYIYAGTEYSAECYCDNYLDPKTKTANTDMGCNMACSGNRTQTCGGGSRLTVFYSGGKPPAGPATNPGPPGWTSMGCYNDSTAARTLSVVGNIQGGPSNMSVLNCVDACQAGSYTFAGVENGGECYCGNQPDHYGGPSLDSPRPGCTTKCAGNSSELCGGSNRMNFYQFGVIAASNDTFTFQDSFSTVPTSTLSTSSPTSTLNSATITSDAQSTSISSSDTALSTTATSNTETSDTIPLTTSAASDPPSTSLSSTSTSSVASSNSPTSASATSSTSTPSVSAVAWVLMGCYTDSTGSRTLLNNAHDVGGGPGNMTHEGCNAACEANNFMYAGTEYSGECWCDNALNNAGKRVTDGCTMACNGDSTQFCGGPDRLTLYGLGVEVPVEIPSTTTSTSSAVTTSAAASNTPYWYAVGCFNDTNDARTLKYNVAAEGGPEGLTHETCQSSCLSLGHSLSGTEYSGECWCDDIIENYGALASDGDALCNMACNGDKTQICGGPNRLTMFKYGIPPSPPTPEWYSLGCYTDSTAARTLKYNVQVSGGPSGLTHETCQASCFAEGHTLSGTEYSGECWCDDELENTGALASDGNAMCNMACNGDATQMCGGPDRLTLFKYGINPDATVELQPVTGSTTSSSVSVPSTVTSTASVILTAPVLTDDTPTETTATDASSPTDASTATATPETPTSTDISTDVPADTSTAATSTIASDSSTVSSATPTATFVNGFMALGCYTDDGGARALSANAAVGGGVANMSIESCTTACQAGGFSYAGTEYSQECWCGNSLMNGHDPAPDGDTGCNMACKGDATEMCGGANRLNMYYYGTSVPTGIQTTAASTTAAPVATELPTGWQYSGCYVDNIGGRIMGNQQVDDTTTTIESCVAKCVGKGYSVAGVEYGVQCFCDNYLRNNAKIVADTQCNMVCPGNKAEKCGDGDRVSVYYDSTVNNGTLNIYKTPVPRTTGLPGNWTYVGCLSDNVDNPSLPKLVELGSANSPEACLSACGTFGYGAAGMEFGTQCCRSLMFLYL
jgi:hypothetical protein